MYSLAWLSRYPFYVLYYIYTRPTQFRCTGRGCEPPEELQVVNHTNVSFCCASIHDKVKAFDVGFDACPRETSSVRPYPATYELAIESQEV